MTAIFTALHRRQDEIRRGGEKSAAVIEEINNFLRFLGEAGCSGFDCSDKSLGIIKKWGIGSGKSPADETLEDIRIDLGDCRRCGLAYDRKNIVFGAGNPNAKLVFVGEAPGVEEDNKGEPFVGAAGSLFDKIIHAMKLTREEVYICNVIKCRPPGNRNPVQNEIKACLPFVKRQIAAIKPKVVCMLGMVAAQSLLNTNELISRLRGVFYNYKKIKALPTYHPAYLLRNPDKKREVWEDMKKIMKVLSV